MIKKIDKPEDWATVEIDRDKLSPEDREAYDYFIDWLAKAMVRHWVKEHERRRRDHDQ